ncbi:DUF3348 family protein [Hydrogenophaga crassostreae]|uniref:DUF3348 family protein n=1 Tax=Hydrogenophaga crassostreae TaxID=1763535 RepID=UPI0012FD035B|nr:DUF3348 family protein [Hydrogenophaga crassostreae]
MRQLSEGSGVGAAAPSGQDFAERLGAWLSVADSITLRTALQAIPSAQKTRPAPSASIDPQSLAEELSRVRATLTQSITTVEPALPGRGRADHSSHGAVPAPVMPLDPAAEFAMLHQRYGEQQRRMEMSVDALRSHAREVLSQASPELAQLAALDGVMDKMLGGREQHLLSTVPAFLKKRFEHLRRQATAEAAADAETLFGEVPNPSQQPTWLVQLAAEFEQALLAELDLRLQPIAGMAEALQSSGH